MHNLYLFRNQLSGKVITSLKHQLQVYFIYITPKTSHLSQIGEHRYGRVLRRDHWVPFAVLTGITSSETCESIYNQLKTGIFITNSFRIQMAHWKTTITLASDANDRMENSPGCR
jgi:hypothetical protein